VADSQFSQDTPPSRQQPKQPPSRMWLFAGLILIVVTLTLAPMFFLRSAEFAGSDDAGSKVVEELEAEYEPWVSPLLETVIGRELPGEVETLFFCVQTGIGVGIIAYAFGYLAARKKYTSEIRSAGQIGQRGQPRQSPEQPETQSGQPEPSDQPPVEIGG